MYSDFKYALRQLIKRPGFTAVAVLILALGIGSNTAVFTVIDALLLRGLAVHNPGELVLIEPKNSSSYFSYPSFVQFRDQNRSLAGIVGFSEAGRSMIANGFGRSDVVPILACGVSGNFFSVLGVPTSLGRALTPDDDRNDSPRYVTVLDHSFWQRQFGSDPAVLGKTILVDNAELTIVGVAAPNFRSVTGRQVNLWTPLQMDPILNPGDLRRFHEPTASGHFWLRIMGRMRPGVKPETVIAELDVIFQRGLTSAGFLPQGPQDHDFGKIELFPGGSGFIANRDQVGSLLNILLIVVGVVLFVACSNVASLLLARTAARQREFALRAALGAGRGRLIRQLMLESLILATGGGLVGLLFAHWGTLTLAGFLPGEAGLDLSLDGLVLSYTAAVTITTGVLVGLIPSLRFSRLDLITALKAQASTVAGGASQKLNRSLVVAQIALSVCLLAGAGLFVRTLENLKNIDVGFNPNSLLMAYLQFDRKYDASHMATASKDLQSAFEALPGVRSATFSWGGGGLMTGADVRWNFFGVEGYAPKPGEPKLYAYTAYVGPRFFETLGVPLLRGRGFGFADVFPLAGQPAQNTTGEIVVNESFARKFFGTIDPIGRPIRIPDDDSAAAYGIKPTTYKVIGVARDTKELNLRDNNLLQFYLPSMVVTQLPGILLPHGMIFELRTLGDPSALASSIQHAIRITDPKMRSMFITTMENSIDQTVFQERMIAQTAGFFSLFALVLASLGLYGVLAYNVTQRTREIGVRMALGARSGNIISLILQQGLGMTAVGCVAGMVAAMALAHLIASRLYGIPALDPLTFVFTIAVLLTVALLACWLPARRATKVDPMIALRAE